MAIFPVRQLGRYGIITDVAPYDLPLEAWSGGRNVRFKNGAIERYDALAKVLDETASQVGDPPAGLVSILSDDDDDKIILVDDNFILRERDGSTVTDVTVVGHTPSVNTTKITSTQLGGITYINRNTNLPVFRLSSGTGAFANLTNWDASWLCQSLRSFKDYLIAINVTKSGTNYPGMVKWSNATQGGAVPDTWDPLAVGSLAGENVLNDIIGSLVDGMPLRNEFIVYSRRQAYMMEEIGAPLVFSFRKIFDDDGIISQNCCVEVDGKHYVFGFTDIYVHDGISRQSLTDDRTKRFIFGNLNRSQQDRCFVAHHEEANEILFAYPSTASDLVVQGEDYCNTAAVFNYVDNTWTFIDLPNVSAMVLGGVSSSLLWSDMTENWSDMAVSWKGLSDTKKRTILVAGRGYGGTVNEALYGFDAITGGILAFPILDETLYESFVTRDKIDMDNLGLDIEVRKLIRKLLPQVRSKTESGTVEFTLGRSAAPGSTTTWDSPVSFDTINSHKIDARLHHRYLSLKYKLEGRSDNIFSGMDIDFIPLSRR